ncbi:hypothetical protein K458DRAFT_167031 [Lentithecium fluviatile CBS 122367]|uniref:Uncharacterized protein n=1 Tax=Lentithecium fluviatile CBS 122367 TaxID=1168545 RepID=A0A6G1IFK6_9PLEO|nr:hypothetical protein K458DRAFT_167031 [Lentithecium fluviatile CBS 122367]
MSVRKYYSRGSRRRSYSGRRRGKRYGGMSKKRSYRGGGSGGRVAKLESAVAELKRGKRQSHVVTAYPETGAVWLTGRPDSDEVGPHLKYFLFPVSQGIPPQVAGSAPPYDGRRRTKQCHVSGFKLRFTVQNLVPVQVCACLYWAKSGPELVPELSGDDGVPRSFPLGRKAAAEDVGFRFLSLGETGLGCPDGPFEVAKDYEGSGGTVWKIASSDGTMFQAQMRPGVAVGRLDWSDSRGEEHTNGGAAMSKLVPGSPGAAGDLRLAELTVFKLHWKLKERLQFCEEVAGRLAAGDHLQVCVQVCAPGSVGLPPGGKDEGSLLAGVVKNVDGKVYFCS